MCLFRHAIAQWAGAMSRSSPLSAHTRIGWHPASGTPFCMLTCFPAQTFNPHQQWRPLHSNMRILILSSDTGAWRCKAPSPWPPPHPTRHPPTHYKHCRPGEVRRPCLHFSPCCDFHLRTAGPWCVWMTASDCGTAQHRVTYPSFTRGGGRQLWPGCLTEPDTTLAQQDVQEPCRQLAGRPTPA